MLLSALVDAGSINQLNLIRQLYEGSATPLPYPLALTDGDPLGPSDSKLTYYGFSINIVL
jgi:hypothetical protein